MSKMNSNYMAAREAAIAWLNSKQMDYQQGVLILSQSGYKPIVCSKLAKQGEKPHTREKLEYEIREMIKVWFAPLAPQHEDVDLEDDAVEGEDGNSEAVSEEDATTMNSGDAESYPKEVARLIYTFRRLYVERSKLHRELATINESNAPALVAQRKELVYKIGVLSTRMAPLAKAREAYDSDKTIPSAEALEVMLAPVDYGSEKTPTPEAENTAKKKSTLAIEDMTIEQLQRAKGNAKSKITKTRNMLMYQTEAKPKDGVQNPMPDCPERVKYEKKLLAQEELVKAINYRLAELS